MEKLPRPAVVSLGVVIVGLYNVNEKAGTWDADYYLYEAWEPQAGFAPQTEIVNEVAHLSEQFSGLDRPEGRCIRARRVRSTLSSPFNLRMFPFDRQNLVLQISDSWLYADQARYDDRPLVHGVDEAVYRQLSQWEVGDTLAYSRQSRVFKWEQGVWGTATPIYDYATFGLVVRRHTTFHLAKFFLPLLVIVFVSMGVFWVDPDDLESQVAIGITCLLAVIAFQLTQASTLPEVAYLTLADLLYVVSYMTIALALVESLYCNRLARQGRKDRALRVDRFARVAFPAGLALLMALAVGFSRAQSG